MIFSKLTFALSAAGMEPTMLINEPLKNSIVRLILSAVCRLAQPNATHKNTQSPTEPSSITFVKLSLSV